MTVLLAKHSSGDDIGVSENRSVFEQCSIIR